VVDLKDKWTALEADGGKSTEEIQAELGRGRPPDQHVERAKEIVLMLAA